MRGPLAPASTILTFQLTWRLHCSQRSWGGDEGADDQAPRARRSPELSPTVPLPTLGFSDLFPLPLNA